MLCSQTTTLNMKEEIKSVITKYTLKPLIIAVVTITSLSANAQTINFAEKMRLKEEFEQLKIDQERTMQQLEQMKRDTEYEKMKATEAARRAESKQIFSEMARARERREMEDRKVIGNARERDEVDFVRRLTGIEKNQKTDKLNAVTLGYIRSWIASTDRRREQLSSALESLKGQPSVSANYQRKQLALEVAKFWELRYLNRVRRIYSTARGRTSISKPTQYLHASTLHTQRSKSQDIAAECEQNLGYLQEVQKTRYLTTVEVQWLGTYIKLLQRAGRRMESFYDRGETTRLYPERNQLPLMESIYSNERNRWNKAGKR